MEHLEDLVLGYLGGLGLVGGLGWFLFHWWGYELLLFIG
jgi:hypothetical protein